MTGSSHFTKLRKGHAAAFHNKRAASASCATGGFYKSPTAGQKVSSSDLLNIQWDTTCLDTKAVDIYLYASGSANPRIHMWETVNFATGSYEATLKPKWWNATSSVNLQLAIVESGSAPFLSTLPAGPVFTATYTAPASGGTPANADLSTPESSVEVVNNLPKETKLSKGKIAAAVLMPILVVVAIIAVVYIKISRKRAAEKKKRFSEMIDKRMSVMSSDWKSITPGGAQAAIRNSMATGDGAGPRASSFSFGAIRPASTVALESGQAGIGARGIDTTTPQVSQLRSGPRINPATGERVSRISFAADTRPSGETRRSQYSQFSTRTSRAFHVGHVPPVPQRQDSGGDISPTQTAGPLTLTAEDITARMSGSDADPRPSVDAVMPALAMMRTGGNESKDDLLLTPKSPSPEPITPPPAAVPRSSVIGIMPMQPMPASMMSPDDMLRAYAERRAVTSPPPVGGPAVPPPAVNYNGGGMRALYSPSTPDTPDTASAMLPAPGSPASAYSNRKSLAPTEYGEDDAYVGTAA